MLGDLKELEGRSILQVTMTVVAKGIDYPEMAGHQSLAPLVGLHRCAMDEPLQSGERKRPAAEGERPERPSKRRRLGQASILCMRELFRTVVNDGDISEDKRILLQNAGVLLSQVDGKTWVSFPDTQGELQELTPQQLRVLRPFFDQVAEELKMREVQLLSDSTPSAGVGSHADSLGCVGIGATSCNGTGSGDHLDCLKLTHVPWADGITARELIACCSPDEALQFNTRWNWLEVLIRILPSKYMLKSRMKELVNYYYIQSLTQEAVTAATRKNDIPKEDENRKNRKIPRRAVALLGQQARLCLQIRERLSMLSLSGKEISVILILKESTPIDFNIDGKPHQITSAPSPGKRLGESGICGLRVMSHPTCGNTEPSGAFLIEYLGTVTARTQIQKSTPMYNTTREVHKVLCAEPLGCWHAEEALEVSAAPDCTLIAVKSEGVEMIMVPLTQAPQQHGAQALIALPSAFDTVLPPGRSAARFMSGLVTQLVLLAAQTVAAVFGRMVQHLPFRDDPAWPLARLFFAVLLQGQIKKFLELIVLIARLRVILCLARSSEIFGFLFFPFVVIAQKVLGWNEGSWLLGCSCDVSSRPSLLSYFPVRAAEGLLACLKAIRHLQTLPGLAMLGVVVDPFIHAVIWIQPAVVFLSDLMFSVGFAEGLAMIVRSVDKSAHHKLVWMSMNVGRMLREGPAVNSVELGDERAEPSASAQVADSPQPLPEWREDGTWNLFDGGD
eukprot:s1218_g12.t11